MVHFLLFLLLLFLGFLALVIIIVLTMMKRVHKVFKETPRPRNVDGPAITDTRPPEEQNRKIVPDNEGEYVEFEEA